MKKSIILSVMCAFILINISNAQEEIKLGVKGSFLTSTFDVEDAGWEKLRPGYDIGIFAQYNISDMLGVSLEPSFAQKGANGFDPLTIYDKYSSKIWEGNMATGAPIEYKSQALSLSVIQVPVLAQIRMDLGGMQMRLFAGPSFDFISSANHLTVRTQTMAGEDFTTDVENSADVTDRFVYTDYTAVVGFGFDIPVDPIDLRIDVKYQHGFTNINNVENKPAMYTRTFGISLGIGLDKLIFN